MKQIDEVFTVAEDSAMESLAIDNIISYFAEGQQDVDPSKTLILVIETIADACKVVPKEQATSTSIELTEFRCYLSDVISQLKGEKPCKFTIVANSYEACINALIEIGQMAERDGCHIVKKRLDYFIEELNNIAQKSSNIANIITLIVILFVIGLIIWRIVEQVRINNMDWDW